VKWIEKPASERRFKENESLSKFYKDVVAVSIILMENEEVIKKILKHLGLWEVKPRPPLKATRPTKIAEYGIGFSTFQLHAKVFSPLIRFSGKMKDYHIMRPLYL
jgi:hypothetical protein